MEIWIPTRNRVVQETYLSLPQELRERVHFAVPHDDKNIVGVFVHKTPPEINGIGPTRQWIIDYATLRGIEKIVMLDDDLVFATRRIDEPTKFREATHDELGLLFARIDSYLDKFAHMGVATREGGNRDTSDTVLNTRLLRILAYRTNVLCNEGIRFDRLEFMEDFDVTLQLLRRGYPNLKINWIVHNQRSSNAPGGCSTYRTLEGQSKAASGLHSLHPEFVSVVTKKTKTAWNGQERQDVRIQWKAAFDSARKVAVLDNREKSDSSPERGPFPSEALE
jgi:TET-Associated Glycosyltransferase